MDIAAKTKVKICPVCGEPLEKSIRFPTFDGTGRMVEHTVSLACACKRKARQEYEERLEKEAKIRDMERLRLHSLMDNRLRDVNFKTYQVTVDNQRLFHVAQKYVANFDTMKEKGQGILFWGDVGTGKSFTAAAIANELMAQLRPVIMTSFVKLVDRLMHLNDPDNEFLIDRLNSADLVVIDDLGAERGTDFSLEKVYDVIDSRYRSGKPMILTTNLKLSDMQNCTDIRYNRIYDRIFEMCYPVKAIGRSWRKANAVSRFDDMKKILGE